MHVVVIGTGYVGLSAACCFAALGHHVTAIDTDSERITRLSMGHMPLHEPHLLDLMHAYMGKNLHFSTNLDAAMADVEVILLAVGTPSKDASGAVDTSFIYSAIDDIINASSEETNALIVTKSTVPVGTNQALADYVAQAKIKGALQGTLAIASNPEFLREGSAYTDFMQPERIILGVDSSHAEHVLRALYAPIIDAIHAPVLVMDYPTAELTKYAANSFLAMKVAFINEMADICEQSGANVHALAEGIGLDSRIGRAFLKAGPGYGGSCFPKDTRALAFCAQQYNTQSHLVRATIASNEQRFERIASRIAALDCQSIAILGLAFKAGTDDVRDSPAIAIIQKLRQLAPELTLYLHDPEAIENAKRLLPENDKVHYTKTPEEALQHAEAVVILTEWPEYAALDWSKTPENSMLRYVLDMRNVLHLASITTLLQQNVKIHMVGASNVQ